MTLHFSTPDVRRLALSVSPGVNESFSSWIDRVANESMLSRVDVWRSLGLAAGGGQPVGYGVALTDEQLTSVCRGTEEAPDSVRRTLLARYSQTAVPLRGLELHRSESVRSWTGRAWAYVWQSHACPMCLRSSDGQWKLQWKLPWSFSCPQHAVYLMGSCPSCGTRFQSSPKDVRQRHVCVGNAIGEMSQRADGSARTHRGEPDICGVRLDDLRPQPMSDSPLAALQSELSALVEGDWSMSQAWATDGPRRGATARDVFADLRASVQLAMHLGSPDLVLGADHDVQVAFQRHCELRDLAIEGTGRRAAGLTNRAYRTAPTDPLLAAAAVRIAAPLVLSDQQTVREHLDAFVAAVDRLPGGRARWWHVMKFWTPPAHLRAPLQEARDRVTFRGLVNLDGRAGRRRATRPRVPGNPAERIPALCWPGAYGWFAGMFPPGGYPESGPRYVSLSLLRSLGRSTLLTGDAAALLGLPRGVEGQYARLNRILRQGGQAQRFSAGLAALAESLASEGVPIRYATRRSALSDFRHIEDSDWLLFCRRAGWNPRSALVDRRRIWVVAWAWCTITGGDWHFAPSLRLAELSTSHRQALSNAYRVFCRTQGAELRDPLERLALRNLRAYRLSGPLTWEPNLTRLELLAPGPSA